MKFVALALTLLLAVGSQARALQADAPSQLEHYRAATLVYLTQVKETAMRTLDHLDGTEYEQYKQKLTESLDQLQTYAMSASESLTPYTDTFSAQLLEATRTLRERVVADVDDLRTQLEPHRVELQAVMQKHVEEYRQKLEPIFQEYSAKNRAEVEALRAQLEPLMVEMRQKVAANVEETKSKLEPMVEVVRAKLTQRLEELRTMAAPYAEEYKEQLVKVAGNLREQLTPHAENLQAKAAPVFEDLKTKFMSLYDTVAAALKA
ncbi:apolipoprotein A-Ia-like [Alosa pseudoharengus]|uniref:apolipoprotein A-Ia-like n=1 Tax=Alosa pseudoharengus TaxID=34774 RepID=UPI003F8C89DE